MGSKKGETIRDIVEDDTQLFTSPVILAEICSKSIRTDGMQRAEERVGFIISRCIIVPIDESIGINAGKIHAEQRSKRKDFGMIDAIILASAARKRAKIITCDVHFKGIEEVSVL